MSLFIKGKNMSKNCYGCDLFSGEGFLCPLVETTTSNWTRIVMHKRVDECPAVEIPTPHGRLIDADELLLRIQNSGNYLSPAILAFIETAETIIDKEE